MAKRNEAGAALFDRSIVMPAIGEAFAKLDPRSLARNPVMFVVGIVAALTTILFIRDVTTGADNLVFSFQIILWLWFTVLFANFAEAIAEGRGKAQAETLRRTKEELKAKLYIDEPRTRRCSAALLARRRDDQLAGDDVNVDTLLLDKTGTITLGNRQATEFIPLTGVVEPRAYA